MTNKEYLRQAYRLDQKINSDIEEVARLREMAGSISSPVLGDKVVDLKSQMRDVIAAVPDTDERMVLRYRYIHNLTWEQIGNELNADKSTIRRWHGSALTHVVLPEDPIKIF